MTCKMSLWMDPENIIETKAVGYETLISELISKLINNIFIFTRFYCNLAPLSPWKESNVFASGKDSFTKSLNEHC